MWSRFHTEEDETPRQHTWVLADMLPFQVFKNQVWDVFSKATFQLRQKLWTFIWELLDESLDHAHAEIMLRAHSSPFWL